MFTVELVYFALKLDGYFLFDSNLTHTLSPNNFFSVPYDHFSFHSFDSISSELQVNMTYCL